MMVASWRIMRLRIMQIILVGMVLFSVVACDDPLLDQWTPPLLGTWLWESSDSLPGHGMARDEWTFHSNYMYTWSRTGLPTSGGPWEFQENGTVLRMCNGPIQVCLFFDVISITGNTLTLDPREKGFLRGPTEYIRQ